MRNQTAALAESPRLTGNYTYPVTNRGARGATPACRAARPVPTAVDITQDEVARFEALICGTRVVRRGEALYRAGDAFESLYTVRMGSFKTVILHRDGLEHVTGFHFTGDTLGLDGVCIDQHGCDAIALEDSIVCIVPFDLLEMLCREVKAIQHHVHRLLSSEIVREATLMMQFGTMSASQRVAALLVDLSSRFAARGYSRTEFNLRMTRDEIGSYLGMKLETVSRMFTRLQKDGLIETNGKHIRIVDLERLSRLV
ncbi:MAG: helix-turn-helix domain-containing protein [Janthinobacterium lividum]